MVGFSKELVFVSVITVMFAVLIVYEVLNFDVIENKEKIIAEGVVKKFYTSSTYDDIKLDSGRYVFYQGRFGCIKARDSIDVGDYVKLEFKETGYHFATFGESLPVHCLMSLEVLTSPDKVE